ncbi:MAG: hypothetical protein EOO07_19350 [Chitinophagaceae bacterium]|nr:MAG: hypothetical protein EOO07_19350 [Chitinophagaceae bacterium]
MLHKPDGSESLFGCSSLECTVILRHEVSAVNETDASCLSMTEVSKRLNEQRGRSKRLLLAFVSKNLTLLKQVLRLIATVPLHKERDFAGNGKQKWVETTFFGFPLFKERDYYQKTKTSAFHRVRSKKIPITFAIGINIFS